MLRCQPFLAGLGIVVATQVAGAAELRSHEAVYDLKLAEPTDQISAIDARIALQLTRADCKATDLDYRFVARFHEESEITVTDQRTKTQETTDGRSMRFDTQTLVDGVEQQAVRGTATTEQNTTTVRYEAPVSREAKIDGASFPFGHTARLIDRAIAGDRFLEARLFDGDAEAEKGLTTTSIITPNDAAPTAAAASGVEGLRSWRITESYFNADSDDDGQPVFETRYRLYENGVSDELTLNFGSYTIEGNLTRLDYKDQPNCDTAGGGR